MTSLGTLSDLKNKMDRPKTSNLVVKMMLFLYLNIRSSDSGGGGGGHSSLVLI